jgi:hypothetical protein
MCNIQADNQTAQTTYQHNSLYGGYVYAYTIIIEIKNVYGRASAYG